MKASVIGFAVHPILAFSFDIPFYVIVSFRSCSITFLIYVRNFLLHIRDSLIDLFVSVVVFFFHFRNGCVHSLVLGSD